MAKTRRTERIVFIMRTLLDHPSAIYPLSAFADSLGAAKSTISEDLSIIKGALERLGIGSLETFAGAAGGVRYLPRTSSADIQRIARELAKKLSEPDRVLPGGFLYMTDIVTDPAWATRIGEIFATKFATSNPDYVVTMETRGIPLALMTSRAMNLPLVVCRRNAGATDGPSVSINYISGSSRKIETMSLPKRAVRPGASALVVDDFMRGGGTAKGIQDLLREFQVDVLGTCVLVATSEPVRKLVDKYYALVTLDGVDEATGKPRVTPVIPEAQEKDPACGIIPAEV